MSFNIIVRKWEHFNTAMGKHITSKHHYIEEMRRGGYVPFGEVEPKRKEYKTSNKAMEIVKTACEMVRAGRGKEIIPSTMRKGMKEVGVSFNQRWLPDHYKEGGFYERDDEKR